MDEALTCIEHLAQQFSAATVVLAGDIPEVPVSVTPPTASTPVPPASLPLPTLTIPPIPDTSKVKSWGAQTLLSPSALSVAGSLSDSLFPQVGDPEVLAGNTTPHYLQEGQTCLDWQTIEGA